MQNHSDTRTFPIIIFTLAIALIAIPLFYQLKNNNSDSNEPIKIADSIYSISDNTLYAQVPSNGDVAVKGADIETFKVFSIGRQDSHIATDKNHVFCGNKILPKMNPQTLKNTGKRGFITDGTHHYYCGEITQKDASMTWLKEIPLLALSQLRITDRPQSWIYPYYDANKEAPPPVPEYKEPTRFQKFLAHDATLVAIIFLVPTFFGYISFKAHIEKIRSTEYYPYTIKDRTLKIKIDKGIIKLQRKAEFTIEINDIKLIRLGICMVFGKNTMKGSGRPAPYIQIINKKGEITKKITFPFDGVGFPTSMENLQEKLRFLKRDLESYSINVRIDDYIEVMR